MSVTSTTCLHCGAVVREGSFVCVGCAKIRKDASEYARMSCHCQTCIPGNTYALPTECHRLWLERGFRTGAEYAYRQATLNK